MIGAGDFCDGITPRGKGGPEGPHRIRQGMNDYTMWPGIDKYMAGNYYFYDGPCQP